MLSPAELDRRNLKRLYRDAFWYGVFNGSTLTFLAVYAARLGATTVQIGLLTSGPAVINLILSMPVSLLLQRWPAPRSTFISAILNRAGYFIPVILPLLAGASGQIRGLVLISILSAIPGTMLAIAANAMVAEVVPLESRAELIGRRVALVSVTLTAASLISGWLLDHIPFPLNYQIVFGLGILGAGLSAYQLWFIRSPRSLAGAGAALEPARLELEKLAFTISQALRTLTQTGGKTLLRLDLLRSAFGPFLASYLLFYVGFFLPTPIFPLFWVQDLRLADSAISLGNSLFYAAMLGFSLLLPWMSRRLSQRRLLVASAMVFSLHPLLTGLAHAPFLFYAACFAGGASWGVGAGASINRLMERVPEDDRPAHMALHNLALNLGMLLGALSGPWLGDWTGLRTGLLVAAGFRMAAGLLLVLWG